MWFDQGMLGGHLVALADVVLSPRLIKLHGVLISWLFGWSRKYLPPRRKAFTSWVFSGEASVVEDVVMSYLVVGYKMSEVALGSRRRWWSVARFEIMGATNAAARSRLKGQASNYR